MSRCFPYPPPNFDRAELESIKLLKEKEKAKRERKKQKKREKNGNEKPSHGHSSNHANGSSKKRKSKETALFVEGGSLHIKTSNDMAEQLEKSGLSEEHELPFSVQTNDSPERSHDSCKRRKVATPNSDHTINGTILRIKLPTVGRRDDVVPATMVGAIHTGAEPAVERRRAQDLSKSSNGSSSGLLVIMPAVNLTVAQSPVMVKHKELVEQQNETSLACRGSTRCSRMSELKFGDRCEQEAPLALKADRPAVTSANEKPCSSGRNTDSIHDLEACPCGSGSARSASRSIRDMGKRFRGLFNNWAPPSLQWDDSDLGDQDWLFDKSRGCTNTNPSRYRHGEVPSTPRTDADALQPRARYLPEFNMYQLPYVVPF